MLDLLAATLLAAAGAEDTEGPKILHTPLAQAALNRELVIEVDLTDPAGIFEPLVYWRVAGEKSFAPQPLAARQGSRYTAAIPASRVTGDIEYFVEAYDGLGNGPSRVGASEKPLRIKGVAGPPAPGAAVSEAPPAPLPLGPILTTGAGALLAAGGAVLYFLAANTVSAIDAKYQPGQGRLPEDHAATQAAITQGQIGSVLVIAGGIAVVGGVIWWLLPAPKEEPAMALRGPAYAGGAGEAARPSRR